MFLKNAEMDTHKTLMNCLAQKFGTMHAYCMPGFGEKKRVV